MNFYFLDQMELPRDQTIRLKVILSYLCFNEKRLTECGSTISIFRAIRDKLIKPDVIGKIIDFKYIEFLKENNASKMAFQKPQNPGKPKKFEKRLQYICVNILQICVFYLENANPEMLDIILQCLNICSNQIEANMDIISALFTKVLSLRTEELEYHFTEIEKCININ